MFGDAQSAAERQPGESASTPRMWEGEETRGDKHGSWTERVQDLRKYAESRGADLPSMPPGSLGHATFADYDPGSLGHATSADYDPGPERRCNSRGENDVQQGVEATMALYSYPRLENGQRFFERMPEERRAELERVKTDLRYMEEQLKNATKARIEEVAATLDTGQPGARSAPPRRY
ncbi:hypothetical protein IMZ48_17475 [Candidatus Bathyarchaeota archaeon]|nr:hypothetical protein [Candidatus Bathyarchaeota archaeon]